MRRKINFRLNELSNATDYLEKAVEFLEKAPEDKWAWKWATIAIQGALNGFLICSIQGTSFINVVQREKGETLAMLNEPAYLMSRKALRVISIWDAWKRCKSMLGYTPTKNQEEAFKFIVEELRNNFEHYRPTHWTIIIPGLPRLFKDLLEVILFLIRDSRRFDHKWSSESKRKEMIQLCIRGIKQCDEMTTLYK